MGKTDTYTLRLNTRVHAKADLLIKRHPHTLSHSWFYQEGVTAAYEKAIEMGETFPDDPLGELIEINNEEIAKIQAATDRLTYLQRKHREQASRSLAGEIPKFKRVTKVRSDGSVEDLSGDD